MQTRTKLLAGITSLALAASAFGVLQWQTNRALNQAETAIAQAEAVAFQEAAWTGNPQGPFEAFASAPEFFGAVGLDGQLVLAGAGQLRLLSQDGAAGAVYRAGEILPPAKLTAIAAGRSLRGPGRALYATTAGEGLLVVTQLDPLRFFQIRAEEPKYRDLTAVLPLGDGRVALGTRRGGVLIYDGRRLKPLHPSLNDLPITALAGDATELWVGTMENGAYRLRAGAIDAVGEEQGLDDPHIAALYRTSTSTYLATPMGLSEWKGGQLRPLAENLFVTAVTEQDSQVLLGTLEQGVFRVTPQATQRPGSSSTRRVEAVPDGEPVRAFVATADGVAAVLPSGLRFVQPEPAAIEPAIAPGALVHSNISSLGFDPAGRLWVGYFDRGLDILSPDGRRELHIEDDTIFCVNRIAADERENRMYVATANGLAVYDAVGQRVDVIRRADGLLADHVTDVLPRPTGLTVATPAGLSFLDKRGARGLYAFHGLVNNHVYALGEHGGELLAGTLGGVSLLQAETVRASFTTANSNLRHNWITAADFVDGEWFLGTYGGGVARLTANGDVVPFPALHGQLEINPLALASSAGRVFAGSLGRGLWVYSQSADRWTQITAGLPSANVTALAVRDGWLWVATDNGLVRVEMSRLPS